MRSETWSKSRLNKHMRRKKAKKKMLPKPPGENIPLTKAQRQELALGQKYRSKYVKKYNLNIKQIAKILEMSVGSVSKLNHKAIKELLKRWT